MSTCIVSFLDLDGVRHSVEVEAEGLYEAAVLALVAFKKHDLELNPAGSPNWTLKLEVQLLTRSQCGEFISGFSKASEVRKRLSRRSGCGHYFKK